MNIEVFRSDVLNPLSKAVPGFIPLRCEGPYQDLLACGDLVSRVEDRAPSVFWFDSAESGNHASLTAIQTAHEDLVVLLKAQYFFAAVFADSLVAAVCSCKDLTLKQFLKGKDHSPLAVLDLADTLGAYTVCVFRHKFLAHLGFPRIRISMGAPGTPIRIFPSRSDGQPTLSPADVATVEELSQRYRGRIRDLDRTTNPYERVSILFYGVPLGRLGSWNRDRTTIDRIAERSLCESLDRVEVFAAVDRFALAVTRAVSLEPGTQEA